MKRHLLGFLLAAIALAAGSAGSWSNLRQLAPGDRVRVELSGREPVEAQFQSVTDQSLQLVRGTQKMEFRRALVVRVDKLPSHKGGFPWIGAASRRLTGGGAETFYQRR